MVEEYTTITIWMHNITTSSGITVVLAHKVVTVTRRLSVIAWLLQTIAVKILRKLAAVCNYWRKECHQEIRIKQAKLLLILRFRDTVLLKVPAIDKHITKLAIISSSLMFLNLREPQTKSLSVVMLMQNKNRLKRATEIKTTEKSLSLTLQPVNPILTLKMKESLLKMLMTLC